MDVGREEEVKLEDGKVPGVPLVWLVVVFTA